MLVERAEQLSGEQAVDLMIEAHMGSAMIDKYGDAVLEYAKRVGREKGASDYYLLECISRTGSPRAVPVLAGWLEEEAREAEAVEIIRALAYLPGGGDAIRAYTNDARSSVAGWARRKAAPK